MLLVFIIAFTACSSKSSSSNPKEVTEKMNIVAHTSVMGDSFIDLSTVEKARDFADIVVYGRVTSIDKTVYEEQDRFVNTYATMQCIHTYKGEVNNSFQFAAGGGYIPVDEYLKHFTKEQADKMGLKQTGDPTAVLKYQFENDNLLSKNTEYVVFIKKEPSGRLFCHVAARVDGDKFYIDDTSNGISKGEAFSKLGVK